MKFLKRYIVANCKLHLPKQKHQFYPLKKEDIIKIYETIPIPTELLEFYSIVGYGFFFHNSSSSFNRLLDPYSFRQINLREDLYEFDPDLELYDNEAYKDKLIFFEVNEGVYLLIDKNDNNGKNAVYYFESKIADSLAEFLEAFDANPNLIKEIE